MLFKYLNLKKTREYTAVNRIDAVPYPGRRKFVKAMGLGALAWNPVLDSIKSVNSGQFQIKVKNNQLKVIRNNKVVWEISENIFEPGYLLRVRQTGDSYIIKAANLKIRQTDLLISLKAEITDLNSHSECYFSIPEWHFRWTGNFANWLSGIEKMQGKIQLNESVISLGNQDNIQANGTFRLTLSPQWKCSFSSSKNIAFTHRQNQFVTGNIILEPFCKFPNTFLKSTAGNLTMVTLSDFTDWKAWINEINLNDGTILAGGNNNPNLCIALPQTKSGRSEKIVFLQHDDGEFHYAAEKMSDTKIQFGRFFYYAEYLNDQPPMTYIAATLPETSQWMTNSLGAFNIEKDNKIPDFEAFGIDNNFSEIIFEPRLRALVHGLKMQLL